MLTKRSQWVSILFCSLPHGSLFKSHEITWFIKPRRCSLMYMSIKTLDYDIFSHQANLSKTTKHWDGFVSHCSSVAMVALLIWILSSFSSKSTAFKSSLVRWRVLFFCSSSSGNSSIVVFGFSFACSNHFQKLNFRSFHSIFPVFQSMRKLYFWSQVKPKIIFCFTRPVT